MDSLPILALAGAAVGGALVGALACWWPLSRMLIDLRSRLVHSEQVRAGAVDRSAKAREQIAQLNRAIADLRRTHNPPSSPASSSTRSPQEAIDKALAEGDRKAFDTRPTATPGFADTEVLPNGV